MRRNLCDLTILRFDLFMRSREVSPGPLDLVLTLKNFSGDFSTSVGRGALQRQKIDKTRWEGSDLSCCG